MFFSNWLHSLSTSLSPARRNKLRRTKARRLPAAASQVLEERLVMTVTGVVDAATKTLVLTGTANDDTVRIYDGGENSTLNNGRWTKSGVNGDYITVEDEARTQTFRKSGFDKISFVGLAGNDTFEASGSLTTSTRKLTFTTSYPVNADGGLGNDKLVGSRNLDTLSGGAGNDSLSGSDQNDLLNGGDGDDSLVGGIYNDTLIGGNGNDTLLDDHGHDRVEGGDGDDTISTGSYDDTIYGGNGNDVIDPGANNDIVYGDAGNDRITDDHGHSSLFGGDGNDTISGGDHVDTIYGGAGDDVIDAGIETDYVYGEAGNDRITDGHGHSSLFGGDGNDTISGGDHEDTIYGGAGDDVIDAGNNNDFVYGEAGNDRITDGHGDSRLEGGDGNDTISGGDHEDTIYGGNGNDVIDAGNNNDLVYGEAGNDLINDDHGHSRLEGGDGDDTINGGEHEDKIYGGNGNDLITGGSWDDQIDGGDGADTIDSGSGDDGVYGGPGNDLLYGGMHNDWVIGDAGADTIYGGDGNDQLRGGANRVDTPALPGTTVVIATLDLADLIEGGDGNDEIQGGLGNDTISGGDGEDHITGQYGDDSLSGDGGDDYVGGQWGADTVNGGEGNDRVDGGWHKGEKAPVATDYLPLFDAADLVLGEAGNDTLTANIGDDTLIGSFGNDKVYGLVGNDYIETGTGNDYVEAGWGNDTVNTGAGDDTVKGDEDNDLIDVGNGNNWVHGGIGRDTIVGGEGDDSLDGAEDPDSIVGGGGNDELRGWTGSDTIYAGAGNDIVWGYSDSDLLDAGDGNDTVYGEDGNDDVTGGGGNDRIEGGNGNDTLRGGFGDDSLHGGRDTDWLYGAGDNSSPSAKDELRGNSGDDILLGGKVVDTEGNNTGGKLGSAQVGTLINQFELKVSSLGDDISYVLKSDKRWTISSLSPSFRTEGNVRLVGGLTSIPLKKGMKVDITQVTAAGTLIDINESFSLPQIPSLAGLDINFGQLTFGFMNGAEIRQNVDGDAPVFDAGMYFVGAVGVNLALTSGSVSVGVPENSLTVIVDPVRGMGYLKKVSSGTTLALGIALEDDLAFRPQAMPDHYTDLIGGNLYVRIDGIEILKVLSVGGGAVIDLPDMSPTDFADLTGDIIDEVFSGGFDTDAFNELMDAIGNMRIGVMGNLDLSIDVLSIELGDASVIYDGEKKDIYFRAQTADSPLNAIPLLKDSGIGKFLKTDSRTVLDGFLDLNDIGNSVVSFDSKFADFELDFDKGVTLSAEIDTPLLDVEVEGYIGWNGDVRLEGHAKGGASVDFGIGGVGVDVGIKMGIDVLIAGNFIEGDLMVDAKLDFAIYGIVSVDLLVTELEFGAKGWANAHFNMTLDDFSDFKGTFGIHAGVRIYYGPGSFSIGGGGEITIDSRGILVDLDHLPSFRIR